MKSRIDLMPIVLFFIFLIFIGDVILFIIHIDLIFENFFKWAYGL
jgi:hypothetical protein